MYTRSVKEPKHFVPSLEEAYTHTSCAMSLPLIVYFLKGSRDSGKGREMVWVSVSQMFQDSQTIHYSTLPSLHTLIISAHVNIIYTGQLEVCQQEQYELLMVVKKHLTMHNSLPLLLGILYMQLPL